VHHQLRRRNQRAKPDREKQSVWEFKNRDYKRENHWGEQKIEMPQEITIKSGSIEAGN